MQVDFPEYGRTSLLVRRTATGEASSISNTSIYGSIRNGGGGFPLPSGGVAGLTDMMGADDSSRHGVGGGEDDDDVLAHYKQISLPGVSGKIHSLKELTDPSKVKLRKRSRAPHSSVNEEGESNSKPRQRRRLENNPDVFGHLAAIRRKQYHMESHSQVVPASPHLPLLLDSQHQSLHSSLSHSPLNGDSNKQSLNNTAATPTKPTNNDVSSTVWQGSTPVVPYNNLSLGTVSPAVVEGSLLLSPAVEGAHFMPPTATFDETHQQATVTGFHETEEGEDGEMNEMGNNSTFVSESDTSFTVPVFEERTRSEEEREDFERNESVLQPIVRGPTTSFIPHTVTTHTLTPHITTPHIVTPHTLIPHTVTPHTLIPHTTSPPPTLNYQPFQHLLPNAATTAHTQPISERLDVANFSIIRYCPREE